MTVRSGCTRNRVDILSSSKEVIHQLFPKIKHTHPVDARNCVLFLGHRNLRFVGCFDLLSFTPLIFFPEYHRIFLAHWCEVAIPEHKSLSSG